MMKAVKNSLKYLATLAVVGALAACGGGDSGPVFDPSVAPKNVQVVAGSDSSGAVWNTVSWNSVSAATDYVVFWSNNPGVTEESNRLTSVDNKLTHEGVLAGQTYYYRVQARSYGETSVISAEAQGTPQQTKTDNNLNDVSWDGEDTLVAVGDSGFIMYRSSGTDDDWTVTQSTVEGSGTSITSVTWDGSQFIAVGSSLTILTSPDGITWDKLAVDVGLTVDLKGVTFTGSKYFAVGGSGTIITSEDGLSWSAVTGISPSVEGDTLNGIVSSGDTADDMIVAVGTNGVILYSDDMGVTWTDQSQVINETANLEDVTWDGVQFVVVGSNDTILTGLIVPDSLDPNRNDIDWVDQQPGTVNTIYVGVTQWDAYLPPAPLLKGAVGSAGDIVVSDDAINWLHVPSGTNKRLSAMTYVLDDLANPYYVIVGNEGTILTNQR